MTNAHLSSDHLATIRKRVAAQRSRYGARWNLILKDRAWLLAEVDRLNRLCDEYRTVAVLSIKSDIEESILDSPPRRAAMAEESNQVFTTAFDLITHIERQREFSERTFGPGLRTEGVSDHIRKELLEIAAAPRDLSEWVDVILLALDGAWRAGYTPMEICEAIGHKQRKNEMRKWPDWRTAPLGKAIEHDRAAVETTSVRFPDNATLRRQIESDPDDDPSAGGGPEP